MTSPCDLGIALPVHKGENVTPVCSLANQITSSPAPNSNLSRGRPTAQAEPTFLINVFSPTTSIYWVLTMCQELFKMLYMHYLN